MFAGDAGRHHGDRRGEATRMGHSMLTGPLLVEMLGRGTAELERNAAAINALNVFPVPDGDTGTNMALTLREALKQVTAMDVSALPVDEAAKHIARGVLLGARGNSGVILSQFLRGFAEGMVGKTEADAEGLARGLEEATAFAYRAVIKPVEGTMLTVGRGASSEARKAADGGADLAGVLRAATEGAARALEKTPEQLPVLKRAGVVDAGGKGLLCFLQGALDACLGGEPRASVETMEKETTFASAEAGMGDIEGVGDALADLHRNLDPADIVHRYCTEFLIRGSGLSIDGIRARLEPLGDSLLVVGDEELVKVHVHTEHPGRALEIGVDYGDLLGIDIDNMREQQQQVASVAAQQASTPEHVTVGGPMAATVGVGGASGGEAAFANGGTLSPEDQRIGVVAVVQGDGWEELLSSLGVDRIVRGGQTMNPSAAELLEAIEAVEAPAVVVLPNNSNIVFAARQAQQLTEREVHVVETSSPPAGVAAMMAFNPLADLADAAVTMDEAVRRVRTAEVACAVRDTDGWGTDIKVGDRIGIVDGDIKVVGTDAEQVVLDTLPHLIDEDTSFISIYYGDDADEGAAAKLVEQIRTGWPDYEVELVRGGQPVYSYLVSAE